MTSHAVERLLPGIVTISPALYAGGDFPRVVGVVSVLETVEPLVVADTGAEDGAVHPAIKIAIKISSTVRMQSERDFLYVIMKLRGDIRYDRWGFLYTSTSRKNYTISYPGVSDMACHGTMSAEYYLNCNYILRTKFHKVIRNIHANLHHISRMITSQT
jgi:hypothetical protein